MFKDIQIPSRRLLLVTEFVCFMVVYHWEIIESWFKKYRAEICPVTKGVELFEVKKEDELILGEYYLHFLSQKENV